MNHQASGIDFSGIRAANPIVDTVSRYIELRRRGSEYLGLCPFHNDKSPSFAVVDSKGKAFCNACHWHGDVIDFVAKYENVEISEAARRLAGHELPSDRPAPRPLPPDEADQWTAILPAPADAPAYDPAKTFNPRSFDKRSGAFGRTVNWAKIASRVDPYLDADGQRLGYVVRLDVDGQKMTPTVTWARHRDGRECWAAVKFPGKRPLQGLDALARRPEAAVLVVSGEKCRDIAASALTGFVAVTWPGGDGAVGKADWSPLAGRRVTLWPDADESGIEACRRLATILYPIAAEVRLITPTDKPKGWDIADAIQHDGWGKEEIIAWVKPRVSVWPSDKDAADDEEGEQAAETEPDGSTVASEPSPPAARVNGSSYPMADDHAIHGEIVDLPAKPDGVYAVTVRWSEMGLVLGNTGTPMPNMDNAVRVLEQHPEFRGRFWFDEFLGRILSTWNVKGEEREWTDGDDIRLALAMQRAISIGRMSVTTARDAVQAIAMAHTRNEAKDWLRSLKWDGEARLVDLLPKGFGAEKNPYTEAVGRCWMISMIARVMRPGCKVDTMPVFEGSQGKGKSTALKVLVSTRWFAEASESPTNKDFFQALQGKMLVEIGEMDAFSRGEVNAVKRVMSCQTDRYRAPYGRRSEDHPRMGVFGGTTNKDDWNRDETGARRFWPVACQSIDLAWIAANRSQLFAEAVARYLSGEPWWDVPSEDALREQEARREVDEWETIIGEYLSTCWTVTVGQVLEHALNISPEDWDKASQMRAARALRVLGWTKESKWEGRRNVKRWIRCKGGEVEREPPI